MRIRFGMRAARASTTISTRVRPVAWREEAGGDVLDSAWREEARRKSAAWAKRCAIGVGSLKTPAGYWPPGLTASDLNLSCPIKCADNSANFRVPRLEGLTAGRSNLLALKWKLRGSSRAKLHPTAHHSATFIRLSHRRFLLGGSAISRSATMTDAAKAAITPSRASPLLPAQPLPGLVFAIRFRPDATSEEQIDQPVVADLVGHWSCWRRFRAWCLAAAAMGIISPID